MELAQAACLCTIAAGTNSARLPFAIVFRAVAANNSIRRAIQMAARAERAVLVAHAAANYFAGTAVDRARLAPSRNACMILWDGGGRSLVFSNLANLIDALA